MIVYQIPDTVETVEAAAVSYRPDGVPVVAVRWLTRIYVAVELRPDGQAVPGCGGLRCARAGPQLSAWLPTASGLWAQGEGTSLLFTSWDGRQLADASSSEASLDYWFPATLVPAVGEHITAYAFAVDRDGYGVLRTNTYWPHLPRNRHHVWADGWHVIDQVAVPLPDCERSGATARTAAAANALIVMTPIRFLRYSLDGFVIRRGADQQWDIGDSIRAPSVVGCHDLSGETLVAASSGRFVARVRAHAVEVYDLRAEVVQADSFGAHAVAFLPDDSFIVAGGGCIDHRVFGERAPRRTWDFTNLGVWPRCLAVAPDGLTAAAAGNKAAVVWDLD